MSGGAETVANRARTMINTGDFVKALQLADASLESDPQSKAGLEVRLSALNALLERSKNPMERGWLRYGIQMTKKRLEEKPLSEDKQPRGEVPPDERPE